MSVVGTAYCCLAVTDLDRSVAWYRAALDVQVLLTNAETCAVGSSVRFAYLANESGAFVLGLQTQPTTVDGDTFHAERVGLDHLAVAVAPGSLKHHLSRLDQHHIEHTRATEWAAGRFVALTDPDGIEVRLFEPVEIP